LENVSSSAWIRKKATQLVKRLNEAVLSCLANGCAQTVTRLKLLRRADLDAEQALRLLCSEACSDAAVRSASPLERRTALRILSATHSFMDAHSLIEAARVKARADITFIDNVALQRNVKLTFLKRGFGRLSHTARCADYCLFAAVWQDICVCGKNTIPGYIQTKS
jgi:hypothetical protein